MVMNEGSLKFTFNESFEVIKFDDEEFYRKYFMKLPEAKGMDFIVNNNKDLIFIEVKDCYGHEKENLYRTRTNFNENEKISLDIEIAKKMESTISCLIGAYTRKERCESAKKLSGLCENFKLSKIQTGEKQLWIILLLEGNFQVKTRTKEMIMSEIQKSLKEKLKWLECKVLVIDIKNYKEKFFKIERENKKAE